MLRVRLFPKSIVDGGVVVPMGSHGSYVLCPFSLVGTLVGIGYSCSR